jgi:hypothetical protein
VSFADLRQFDAALAALRGRDFLGKGKPIAELPSAAGEDYTDVILPRGFDEVGIRLPSGQRVEIAWQRK